MSFQQIVLLVGALAFAGFAVMLFIAPQKMSAVDVGVSTANARVEIRAMYGGCELGIAIFLLLCVAIRDWQFMGLALQFLAIAGIAVARIAAIVLERLRVRPLLYLFAALELATAVVTFLAMR